MNKTIFPLLLIFTLFFEIGLSAMSNCEVLDFHIELPSESESEEKREADIEISQKTSHCNNHNLLDLFLNTEEHYLFFSIVQEHYAEIPDPPPDPFS